MPLPYTPALALAEHLRFNAARLGCPLAMALADISLARALNTALALQAEADYQADPEGCAADLAHAEACAGEEYANASID